MHRENTKKVSIGGVSIGGCNNVVIQSMTNTKTEDVEATVSQILELEKAGCELIRCTVPTMEAARAIREIKKQIHIPLIADIHFDYKLAIAAIENGADKIRINPGNIGSVDRVQKVVDTAKKYNVPIRVGVNSGSLEKEKIEKYGGVTAAGIAESAIEKVKLIEDMGYDNLVVSIKSSDVMMCVEAHKIIAGMTNHPIHVGITEAGTITSGNIKSAIGLALILNEGIGDTIRVSLTDAPVQEIYSAKLILKTLGLRKAGVTVVSCPTCGRTNIDIISLAKFFCNMSSERDVREFCYRCKTSLRFQEVILLCKTINIGNSHDRYFPEMFGYKLPVDGNDIMHILNIGPCKKVKEVQDSLMEFVFNHGIVDRETLVKEIEDFK